MWSSSSPSQLLLKTLTTLTLILLINPISLIDSQHKYADNCQCPINLASGSYCGHEMLKTKLYFKNETAVLTGCGANSIYSCNRTLNIKARFASACDSKKSPGMCVRVKEEYVLVDEDTHDEEQMSEMTLRCYGSDGKTIKKLFKKKAVPKNSTTNHTVPG